MGFSRQEYWSGVPSPSLLRVMSSYKRIGVTLLRISSRGFPGGSVVKNLPTNAGDTGSILGPGRSHILWSNYALCATATEFVLWSLGPAGTAEAHTP